MSTITGSKILRILKGTGLAPELPEDLYFMIKKMSCSSINRPRSRLQVFFGATQSFLVHFHYSHAVSIRKHLERNRKDKDGKFR